MRAIFRDEQKQNEFMRKGYAQFPFLSANDVNHLLAEMKELTPDDRFDPDGSAICRNTFHSSFLDTNADYKQKTYDLISELVGPRLKDILADYKILLCQFVVKPPGKGDLLPHQNWNFVRNHKNTTVTVWCPLTDVGVSNGTLRVVEASHKISPFIAAPFLPNYCANFEAEIREKYSTPITLNAGECVIFDDSLLHWSEPNRSKESRDVMVVECIPAESVGTIFFFDRESPENEFEVLEVDSSFFVRNTPDRLLRRPPNVNGLGFVPNNNELLSEAQFLDLMGKGEDTRNKLYNGEITEDSNGLMDRLKFWKHLMN